MWKNANKTLPKKSGKYLCWVTGTNGINGNQIDEPIVVYFNADSKEWGNFFTITHWRKLPATPNSKFNRTARINRLPVKQMLGCITSAKQV